MIKPIVKDIFFLQQKSQEASQADLSVGQDLLDTLQAHQDECLGMAANMIGVKKRIIVISLGGLPLVMYNPRLKKKAQPYQTEESCLSLTGSRKTTRYKEILIDYLDATWTKRTLTLKGLSAQICQHELDHLEGILI